MYISQGKLIFFLIGGYAAKYQVYLQKSEQHFLLHRILCVEYKKVDPLSVAPSCWPHECIHTIPSLGLSKILLMSWIWEVRFVKDLLDHLVLSLWVCAELFLMKYFQFKPFHLWWFITVLFLMFMPHIVSQRINFSGHSPLRVFYVCETALNFGAKREALQTTGWDFGDELLKCNSVGNDWIYDTAIRGYRHFHFKTKIQRFQLFKSFIMVIFTAPIQNILFYWKLV